MGVRSLILKLKHHERLTTCQAYSARQQTMAHLGDIFEKGGSYFAKIDTNEMGVRYAMKGPLQAASVFRGQENRPDRAEGNLYVHGSRPALYVQPTCLDVQRILCTVKLSRNSI